MDMNITTSPLNASVNESTTQTQKLPEVKIYALSISLAFQMAFVAIGAVGIAGNLLALIVFLGHKPLLKRPANCFLVSQSAINLVVSIMLILVITIDGNRWSPSAMVPMCYLWNSRAVFVGLVLSGVYNITLMTVERYLEVVHPIKHHLKISKGKVIISSIVGTVFSIVFKLSIGCPSVKVVNGVCTSAAYATLAAKRMAGVANLLVEFLIPVGVFTFCYTSMALSLRRLSRTTKPGTDASAMDPKIARARRNIIKTLFIVVLAFVICTTFKQIILSMASLGDVALNLSGITYNVAQLLSYLNCCNDPFIYGFHYEEFRVGLRKLFCRYKVTPSAASNTTNMETITRS